MFTDVYVGLVKSDKFDYDKPGDPNSYSPDFALESFRPANKPYLSGERDFGSCCCHRSPAGRTS